MGQKKIENKKLKTKIETRIEKEEAVDAQKRKIYIYFLLKSVENII